MVILSLGDKNKQAHENLRGAFFALLIEKKQRKLSLWSG
jgi:hypothetical protein